MMVLQGLVVAALVIGCAGYALWALLPAAAKRVVLVQASKRSWPAGWSARIDAAMSRQGGCGCDGCDAGKPRPAGSRAAGGVQPIKIHRRR